MAVVDWRSSHATPFHLRDVAGDAFVLDCHAGIQHLLIVNAHRAVQLAVRGTSLLRPSYLLTELSVPPSKERLRLAAIADFNALMGSVRHPRKRALSFQSCDRFRLVLQALDGFLARASQREIAEALFGISRVRRDWCDAGGHMRDRVRRAVRRGRTLMNGGYRSLLR
jgi:hypothetical protein